MIFYNVAVPEAGLNNLTYQCDAEIKIGVRVHVEVKKSTRVGFIVGKSCENPFPDVGGRLPIEIKKIGALVNEIQQPVINPDLWDMALYAGRVSLCGVAQALKTVLPRPLITGHKINNTSVKFNFNPAKFHKINFFNPFDSERFNFYLSGLNINERTLILFSRKDSAANFFESLPDWLKPRALLWPSGGANYFSSWLDVYYGKYDIVVGSAGAVFAPLMPEKIIIEDEAGTSYIIPPVLNLSARTLAEHRAAFTGAKLIIGGRMPSLKTFKESHPEEKILPEREKIILADILNKKAFREKNPGVEGNIPLTMPLIKNTYRELMKQNTVIWILDRLGVSSEVFCMNCGKTVKCPKCKNTMMSRNEGTLLKCPVCGTVMELPEKCGHCGFENFSGKRPGLESLLEIANKHYGNVILYADKYSGSRIKKNSLILSTRRGLELCEKLQPSLIAWLDFDLELAFPGHETRLEAFKALYDSYWRGREKNSARKVLIQSRNMGMRTARFLSHGWEKFLTDELAQRQEFALPPFGYAIELEPQKVELREKILDAFSLSGIFVMDSGDETQPLRIDTDSIKLVEEILRSIKFSPKELKITVKN